MTSQSDELAQELAESGDEDLRDKGRKIAEMVEAEASAAEAETEPEIVDDNDHMPCPTCGHPVLILSVPMQDREKERCAACAGWGMTATGSLAPDQQIAPCSTCQGRGWTNVVVSYQPPAEPTQEQVAPVARTETVSTEFPPVVIPDLSNVQLS